MNKNLKGTKFPYNLYCELMRICDYTEDIEDSEIEKLVNIIDSLHEPLFSEIIKTRYTVEGSSVNTYKQIGQKFNITPTKASQILHKALRLIRIEIYRKKVEQNTSNEKFESLFDDIESNIEKILNYKIHQFAVDTQTSTWKRYLHKKGINTLGDIKKYIEGFTAWRYRGGDLFPSINNVQMLKMRGLGKKTYAKVFVEFKLKELNQFFKHDGYTGSLYDSFRSWDEFSQCDISLVIRDINLKRALKDGMHVDTVADFMCKNFSSPDINTNQAWLKNYNLTSQDYLVLFEILHIADFKGSELCQKLTIRNTKLFDGITDIKDTTYPFNLYCDVMNIPYSEDMASDEISNFLHYVDTYINWDYGQKLIKFRYAETKNIQDVIHSIYKNYYDFSNIEMELIRVINYIREKIKE